MITEKETNKLYLSSLIKSEKYAPFWKDFERILTKHHIPIEFIEGTRDIWCRDYMPIQVSEKEFVQFKYFPDYCLTHEHVGKLTIQGELGYNLPDGASIKHVDLIVDGGNIVKSKNKAIMTKKVFKENKNRLEKSVIKMLKKALKVDEIFFIPIQPYDYTGHADGMVRLIDDNTLLVNDYSKETSSWRKEFENAIKQIGIEPIELPYAYSDKNEEGDWKADGCYINYLQIGDLIIFPQFNLNQDGEALSKIKKLYSEPNFHVEPIDARLIANDGGVLNCITWNIHKHIIENAIDQIIPVFGSKKHMLVIHIDESKPIKDTVCVQLFPEKGLIGQSWSLQKLIKRVETIYEIGINERPVYRKLLLSSYSLEQLSDILKILTHPSERVFESLISIPGRLSKYKPGN